MRIAHNCCVKTVIDVTVSLFSVLFLVPNVLCFRKKLNACKVFAISETSTGVNRQASQKISCSSVNLTKPRNVLVCNDVKKSEMTHLCLSLFNDSFYVWLRN